VDPPVPRKVRVDDRDDGGAVSCGSPWQPYAGGYAEPWSWPDTFDKEPAYVDPDRRSMLKAIEFYWRAAFDSNEPGEPWERTLIIVEKLVLCY